MSDREARDLRSRKKSVNQRYPNIGNFPDTDGMALLALLHDLVEAFEIDKFPKPLQSKYFAFGSVGVSDEASSETGDRPLNHE